MGRHSASDGEEDELSAADSAESAGPTERTDGADWPSAAEPTSATGRTGPAPSGVSVGPAPADSYAGTRGDMHLLRESPSLRARCAAAVLVPFLVYTIVLIVIGRTDVYLIWLWLPTVLAGVLVGVFLDSAHRRLRVRGPAAAVVTTAISVGADGDGPDGPAAPAVTDDAEVVETREGVEPSDKPAEPVVVDGPEVGLDIVAGADGSVDEH